MASAALKAVPAVVPFAAALFELKALEDAIVALVGLESEGVDLRFARLKGEAGIGVVITLKPFLDATRTLLKLESGMLRGYRVTDVRTSLEKTSSSRRIVTAFILPENAHG